MPSSAVPTPQLYNFLLLDLEDRKALCLWVYDIFCTQERAEGETPRQAFRETLHFLCAAEGAPEGMAEAFLELMSDFF